MPNGSQWWAMPRTHSTARTTPQGFATPRNGSTSLAPLLTASLSVRVKGAEDSRRSTRVSHNRRAVRHYAARSVSRDGDPEVLRHSHREARCVVELTSAYDRWPLPHVAPNVREVGTTPRMHPPHRRRRPSVRIHTWLHVRQIQPVITPSGRLRPGPNPAPTAQAAPRHYPGKDDPYRNAPPHTPRTLHASEWFHQPRTAPHCLTGARLVGASWVGDCAG
jgi:hypothetical protein